MPQQIVPSHLLPVGLGVRQNGITGAVGERTLRGFGGIPLHLVLGRDHVELALQDGGVTGVVQLEARYRRTEVPALLGRGPFQGAASLSPLGQEYQAPGHRRRTHDGRHN